jgi:hypothetical protein
MADYSINDILSQDTIRKIPPYLQKGLERDITAFAEGVQKTLEQENAKRFDAIIESLQNEFESTAKGAIVEAVEIQASAALNQKLVNVLTGLAGVLESSGIPTTEQTKVLMKKLKDSDENLRAAYLARQDAEKQLNEAQKMNLVLKVTHGYSAEISQAAQEYFKDKHPDEVDERAIADFIEGKKNDSGLRTNFSAEFDRNGDVNLDAVRKELDDIGTQRSLGESKEDRKKAVLAQFEGLSNPKVGGQDTDIQAITEAAMNDHHDDLGDYDVNEALKSIKALDIFNFRR